jgi:hypothetical protein
MTIARMFIKSGGYAYKDPNGDLCFYADHCREMEALKERCAKILENGSFLSNESLEAKWAKQVAALIRQEAT